MLLSNLPAKLTNFLDNFISVCLIYYDIIVLPSNKLESQAKQYCSMGMYWLPP